MKPASSRWHWRGWKQVDAGVQMSDCEFTQGAEPVGVTQLMAQSITAKQKQFYLIGLCFSAIM